MDGTISWNKLRAAEKAKVIQLALDNGVSDINTIMDTFNVYAKDSLANVDYNMAAAKASGFGSNGNGHYPDTFKKPNHPTFSDESIYHSEATPGGHWSERNSLQRWNFSPSTRQISEPGYIQKAIDYLNNSESEGVILTDSQGRCPSINGTIYLGVLPEVTVTHQYKGGGSKKQGFLYNQSRKIMEGFRRVRNYENITGNPKEADFSRYLEQFKIGYRDADNPLIIKAPSGVPQDAYLLPTRLFDKKMLEAGYTHGQSKDYGTVNRAATLLGERLGKEIPVYQRYPDAIDKKHLIHLGSDIDFPSYRGEMVNPKQLEHAGSYASAYYIDPIAGQLYVKGWDLNDYSPLSLAHNPYNTAITKLSSILDRVGNPAVYTTGFQPAIDGKMAGKYPNLEKLKNEYDARPKDMRLFNKYLDGKITKDRIDNILSPLLEKKGLYKHVYDDEYFFSPIREEVVVTPQYKDGGKIYIKPSKRGTFTAAATKHGKSVQEFARQVLANKENYSPAMVRKAVFAHNSKSWKHSTGGPLYPFSFSKNPYWKTPIVRYDEGGNLFGHTFDGDSESKITYAGANTETVPFNLFDLKSWKYHGSPSYGDNFSFAQAFTDAVAQQAPYFKWGEGMYNTNINWSKRFAKTDDGKKPFKEFAETMYPAVISVLQENNYPIDMADNIVRQAALESDYGLKDVGGKGYNLSGIKWFNTMPDRKHATNPRDSLEYIDFDDLHDYLNFKVQLLNNRYDALNATSTQDFIDRLHPKASGRDKKGRDYSGNYKSYKTNLPRTSSLNKFLNSLIIKTE